MTSVVMVRRAPMPGEVGCVGACPLCTKPGSTKAYPPCLACRETLRERVAALQLTYYMARALN